MTDIDFEIEDNQSTSKSSGFDLKRFLRRLLFNVHWIILSAMLGWYVSKIYLRYQIPIYQVSGSIYIGNGEFNENANAVLKTVGLVDNSSNNINNQVFILKSYNLIGQVVDSMHLNILLSNNGRIKQQPINLDVFPYDINVKRNSSQNTVEYALELTKDGFELEGKNHTKYKGKLGTYLPLSQGDTILITKNDSLAKDDAFNSLLLRLQPRDATIAQYQSRLTVLPSKQANEMLELTLSDEHPDRAKHFLNTLLYYYNASAIAYKNQAIQKASQFLDNRIADVSKEIDLLENNTKDVKIRYKLNDVSEATNQTLNQLNSVDAQKSVLGFNQELVGLVERHIKSYDKRDEIVPNQLTITDPVLAGMVSDYNQLLLQKRTLKDIGTEKDPVLKRLEGQLEELRNNILKNIQNIKTQFSASDQYYTSQASKLTDKFKELPDVQKNIIQIERQLNIKQTLYEFLLQKKEEIGVQLASGDVTSSRLVDTPRNKGMLQPQARNIYSTGIGIGFLLPILTIFFIQFLNKKIQSKRDVEALTDIPIIGEINEVPEDKKQKSLFENVQSRAVVVEQYRSLRANLQYIGIGNNKQVLLVTSFMRDEGKSFTSLNLADVLSQSGKKVVVLEFDLRRPKLSHKVGYSNLIGLSSYMAGNSTNLDDLVRKVSNDNENLYIIGSGPIPPNPSELLLQDKMDTLFAYLKTNFDYIILDTAPLGLVSDTFSIAKYADATLYIVRHQFSIKQTLQFINQLNEKKRLPRISIVINGIKSAGFDYGYGYGYGYAGTNGYGYSETPAKTKWLNFFSNKK